MCCKCDLGDVEIQPTEPDKAKETQTDVNNPETPTNENILQEATSPPENAQQPTVDTVETVETIEKEDNVIQEEIPPEEITPEKIPAEEKSEENPEN